MSYKPSPSCGNATPGSDSREGVSSCHVSRLGPTTSHAVFRYMEAKVCQGRKRACPEPRLARRQERRRCLLSDLSTGTHAGPGQMETLDVTTPAPGSRPSRRGPVVLLVGLFVVCFLLAALGRSHRGTAGEVRFRRAYALLIPCFTVPMQVLQLCPANSGLESLPLQLCDFAWLAAIVALWTRHWAATALVYFWGLTLTIREAVSPFADRPVPTPAVLHVLGHAPLHGMGRGVPHLRAQCAPQLAQLPVRGGHHRWMGGDGDDVQRARRHRLRLPQPQARSRHPPRPVRTMARLRRGGDRHRRRSLGTDDLALDPRPRPAAVDAPQHKEQSSP